MKTYTNKQCDTCAINGFWGCKRVEGLHNPRIQVTLDAKCFDFDFKHWVMCDNLGEHRVEASNKSQAFDKFQDMYCSSDIGDIVEVKKLVIIQPAPIRKISCNVSFNFDDKEQQTTKEVKK